MITGQDSREFENLPIRESASAAQSSAQISNSQNLNSQNTMGNAQQMIDEVIAEQIRIEQQQQIANQNCQSRPEDDPMSSQLALGRVPEGYNIGTPPQGSTGSLQPRATAGGYGPILPGTSGRGRRLSPRTLGRSPRGDRAVSGSGRRTRDRALSDGLLKSKALLRSCSSSGSLTKTNLVKWLRILNALGAWKRIWRFPHGNTESPRGSLSRLAANWSMHTSLL